MSVELASTGHPMVDALRQVQLESKGIVVDPLDPESLQEKLDFVEERIEKLGATSLYGEEVFVDTRGLWIFRPAPDPTARFYNQPYALQAPVVTVMHLLNPDFAIDDLSLRFLSPTVLNIPVLGKKTPFDDRFVDVPVLAINTCKPQVAA